MRIIGGVFGGRRLFPPKDQATRPITDRAKQSLFDILSPRIPDAAVYDLFSGTGSMGLECISRDARHATFFDADRSAVARLRRNIEVLGVQDRATVVSGDLFKYFASRSPTSGLDLIFLDPPYRFLRERPQDLQQLGATLATYLTPDGLLIFRHHPKDTLALPPLHMTDQRTYGRMCIDFLQRT
jgi:16S rRNA (guanine966-N2)-methyltransferase